MTSSNSSGKRKLPVIQSTDDVNEPPRPKWQWIVFDVLVTLAVWVGLSAPAKLLQTKLVPQDGPMTAQQMVVASIPQLVVMIAATSFGGYLLGRFGGPTAAVREALIAAAIVGALAAFIFLGVPGIATGTSVAIALGIAVAIVACAFGGAVFGRRKR